MRVNTDSIECKYGNRVRLSLRDCGSEGCQHRPVKTPNEHCAPEGCSPHRCGLITRANLSPSACRAEARWALGPNGPIAGRIAGRGPMAVCGRPGDGIDFPRRIARSHGRESRRLEGATEPERDAHASRSAGPAATSAISNATHSEETVRGFGVICARFST